MTPHNFVLTWKFPTIKNHYVPLLPEEIVRNGPGCFTVRRKSDKVTSSLISFSTPDFLSKVDPTLFSRKYINPSVPKLAPHAKLKQLSVSDFFADIPIEVKIMPTVHSSHTSEFSKTPIPEHPINNAQELSAYNNDIANYYRAVSTLTDGQKYDLLYHVWKPSTNCTFPPNSSGRRFQTKWLEELPWLCYSALLDGAFCINCILFRCESAHNALKLSYLYKEPFKCWPIKRFRYHASKSSVHTTATLC